MVLVFFACMFAILCLMAALHFLTWFVPFAFIPGVVLGDAGLYLAHQVRAHVGSLGEDAAAHT